ncbi:hypothetical protein AXW37_15270 [Yersinia ruckeri]|uniref:Uncharacterized protein n=1 Tax=Yersinia ruckeri TaxID=29486 RepID=A0A380QNW1_YERRU|nr:hypothetical protein BD65_2372 [Yersinia ruckeri]KGA49823.1 hypothetical protein DJ39_250 [Yersinia ruckeri ATCC 29473]AKA39072.1 hypothetical protein UGYR_12150 [Yersinia ruckeri]ARZ02439.1 hypothetical protein QMA0440_03134 [Yersinia ruckeri]KFE39746.1 hypothetical protein nADLYRO1b_778 [Yersinia ruckeri]
MKIREVKIATMSRHHEMSGSPYMRHFFVVIFHFRNVSLFLNNGLMRAILIITMIHSVMYVTFY